MMCGRTSRMEEEDQNDDKTASTHEMTPRGRTVAIILAPAGGVQKARALDSLSTGVG